MLDFVILLIQQPHLVAWIPGFSIANAVDVLVDLGKGLLINFFTLSFLNLCYLLFSTSSKSASNKRNEILSSSSLIILFHFSNYILDPLRSQCHISHIHIPQYYEISRLLQFIGKIKVCGFYWRKIIYYVAVVVPKFKLFDFYPTVSIIICNLLKEMILFR